MADINLNVGANTRQAERDIQKLVNRNYNINLRTKGDQPLGRITGQVNEFTKSLDASNARVIAFGASAGIIFGVQRAFQALASSVIDTQKSLQDINVILNVSSTELNKFGSNLFSIAKNTGQSFQEVAKAATEFSRQGLGVEETLKRTNEALILSRLSGLDAAKSVEALTAAVNSYASEAVTASEIVNKFANVDAAFAVSSADLAEALSRVGSSAAQSGVDLNELIAIVTSAQQTTARGGAVIGNSFKTIFTRLQRGSVINLLDNLGVNTKESSGEIKSTIDLLTDLARVYDQLGTLEQADVAEKVGGVFQINILKAALSDLGKEYSIYNNALQVASSTTDQAIRRNAELNKTYAAQLNALRENAKQAGTGIGDRLFGPAFDRVVGNANDILGGINEDDGKGVGATLGKGILDGLGQVIAGPGLALLGGIFIKLFSDLAKFATGSLKELLNLNTASKQQAQLQQGIGAILQKNPELFKLMQQGTAGLNKGAEILLSSLRAQTLELQKQEAISAKIATQFIRSGSVTVAGGVPVAKTPKPGRPGKATGYIPNFAEVSQAKELGAKSNVKAVRGIGKISGKPFEANNQEFQLRNFAGTGETAVIPKYGGGIKEATKMIARGESGSVLDKSDRNRAKGFIPNFAYAYKMKTFAGEGVKNPRAEKQFNKFFNKGGFSNVEIDDKINTVGFKIQQIPLTPKLQELYNTQPGSPTFTKEFEDYAIKRLGFINAGAAKSGNVKLYGGTSSAVDGYRISNGLAEFLEVKGGSFETLSVANKFGRVLPENLARFTQSQLGIQYLNALFKEGIPKERDTVKLKNTLAVPQAPKARRGNFNRPFKVADIEANRARNFGRAGGFIPNFAQTKEPSTQLGNLDKIPNKLGNKVLSLIYPGISEGYTLRPATASYLKKQYTGNIPVAGISQKKLQSQLPDIDKNIGNLLVKEANQFGQALGGFNFLKSPEELPNYGAAKGAVGVAFEGGVQTLLQQKVGKQNAGIDFRNITPRLRSVFNNAPGVYDAKRSPDLTNEVLQKLLNETKPGAIVQKSSGKAGAAYLKQRSAAVEQLRKEGVTGSVAIRQALKDRFGIVGKAAGYIPNFAAQQIADVMALETAMSGQKAIFDTKPFPHVRNKSQPTFGSAMADHGGKKQALKDSLMGQKRAGLASGFIPNFAAEDTAPADAGASLAALATQLIGVGLLFQGAGQQYKSSLEDLTQENIKNARVQKRTAQERRAIFDRELQAGKTTVEAAQTANYAPGRGQKIGAAFNANALGIGFAAPVLAETIVNAIGKESKEARTGGAAVSALGQTASFAAFGSLFGPWGTAIGAATGLTLGFTNIIKQASTDIPELSEAARKASENLTKINDAGQKVQTGFEQIQGLRESGQAEKAGELEAELLSFIRKEFKDTPDVSAELQASLKNQDFKSLQEVIKKNTDAVLKNTLTQDRKLLVGSFFEEFGRDGGEKQTNQFQEIIGLPDLKGGNLDKFIELSERASKLNPDVVEFGTSPAARSGQVVPNEEREVAVKTANGLNQEFIAFLESIGRSKEEIDKFRAAFARNPAAAIEKLAESKEAADNIKVAADLAAKYTEDGNGVIARILPTLRIIDEKYKKLAQQIESEIQLQVLRNSVARDVNNSIKQAQLDTEAVQEEVFGVSTPSGKMDKKTEAGLNQVTDSIKVEIENSIGSLIGEISTAFVQDIGSAIAAAKEIGGGPDAEQNAETNIALVEAAIAKFGALENGQINSTEVFEQIRSLFEFNPADLLNPDYKGINPDQKLAEVAELLGKDINNPKEKEFFDNLRKGIEKTNIELIKNRGELIKQYAQFANQKFQERLREITQAMNSAFGGLDDFVDKNREPVTKALEQAIANLKIIGPLEGGDKALIEVGQNLQRVVDELSKLVGMNIGQFLEEDGAVLGAIKDARALDIEKSINRVIRSVGGLGGEYGPELLDAFRKALQDIFPEGSFENLSPQELVQAYSKAVAEQQVNTRNKTGKLNQEVIDRAKESLPEELRGFLDLKADFVPIEQLISIQFIQANQTLKEILGVLGGDTGEGNSNATLPSAEESTTNNARGSIPSEAMSAAIREHKAIKNGVGGARPSDKPTFIPNFNGSAIVANTGEKLIRNYMGTKKDALLTREMQNAAEGSIPTTEEEILTDAIRRAAKVTSTVGKYTGTNIGSDEAFGKAMQEPKARLLPPIIDQKTGKKSKTAANAGPFLFGDSDYVNFYTRNPDVGTVFNEATHINQNQTDKKVRNMGLIPGEFVMASKEIEKAGGKEKYLQNLKKFADFLEKQNNQARKKFTAITDIQTQMGLPNDAVKKLVGDTRLFTAPNMRSVITSEGSALGQLGKTKYILERASTLNNVLVNGITAKEITASELTELGMPLDIAKALVSETLAIDEQLKKQRSVKPPESPIKPSVKPGAMVKPGSARPNSRVKPQTTQSGNKMKPSVISPIRRQTTTSATIPSIESPFSTKAYRKRGFKDPSPEEIAEYQQSQSRSATFKEQSPRTTKTSWILAGGERDMPARQTNLKTGDGMEAPRATPVFERTSTPNNNGETNGKKDNQPLSQEELKRLMPPEYFERIGRRQISTLGESYDDLIRNTKDPNKAMALRKKMDEIKNLGRQGKWEELDSIYKSYNMERPSTPVGEVVNKIANQTSESSQEELKRLMPPEYFERIGRRQISTLGEAYDDLIRNTSRRDPDKAMALRKKMDGFKSLARQGKWEELENIYNSHEVINKPSENFKKDYLVDVIGVDKYNQIRNSPGGLEAWAESRNEDKIPNRANGYLPDMDRFLEIAKKMSMEKEMQEGFSPNEIYQKKQPELQGIKNPEGLGTFNKPQEGNTAKERIAMTNRMYIPNFANSAPQSQSPVSVNLGGLNITEAQTGGKSKDYAKDFSAEIESRVGPLITQIKSDMDQKYGRSLEIVNEAERQGKLPRVPPRSRGGAA